LKKSPLTPVKVLAGDSAGEGSVDPNTCVKELLKDVTRVTIIDHTEKNRFGSFERWKIKLTPMIQDGKRTLKLVIEDNPDVPGPGPLFGVMPTANIMETKK